MAVGEAALESLATTRVRRLRLDEKRNSLARVILISRIVSWAGLLVAWVGIWISTSPVASLVIIGGTLLLFAGSLLGGLRRRRADGVISREDAQRGYDNLRVAFIANRLMVPVICVLIIIYVDATLGRALVVGGLLINTFAGIPGEREILARLRTRAEAPSGSTA